MALAGVGHTLASPHEWRVPQLRVIPLIGQFRDDGTRTAAYPGPKPLMCNLQGTMLPVMAAARSALSVEEAPQSLAKVSSKFYEEELARLQVELVKQQEYVRSHGLKVVVIFEGRDAAGKGGAIKGITETLNPRAARLVARAA